MFSTVEAEAEDYYNSKVWNEIRETLTRVRCKRSRAKLLQKLSQADHVRRMKSARNQEEHQSPVFVLPSNFPATARKSEVLRIHPIFQKKSSELMANGINIPTDEMGNKKYFSSTRRADSFMNSVRSASAKKKPITTFQSCSLENCPFRQEEILGNASSSLSKRAGQNKDVDFPSQRSTSNVPPGEVGSTVKKQLSVFSKTCARPTRKPREATEIDCNRIAKLFKDRKTQTYAISDRHVLPYFSPVSYGHSSIVPTSQSVASMNTGKSLTLKSPNEFHKKAESCFDNQFRLGNSYPQSEVKPLCMPIADSRTSENNRKLENTFQSKCTIRSDSILPTTSSQTTGFVIDTNKCSTWLSHDVLSLDSLDNSKMAICRPATNGRYPTALKSVVPAKSLKQITTFKPASKAGPQPKQEKEAKYSKIPVHASRFTGVPMRGSKKEALQKKSPSIQKGISKTAKGINKVSKIPSALNTAPNPNAVVSSWLINMPKSVNSELLVDRKTDIAIKEESLSSTTKDVLRPVDLKTKNVVPFCVEKDTFASFLERNFGPQTRSKSPACETSPVKENSKHMPGHVSTAAEAEQQNVSLMAGKEKGKNSRDFLEKPIEKFMNEINFGLVSNSDSEEINTETPETLWGRGSLEGSRLVKGRKVPGSN